MIESFAEGRVRLRSPLLMDAVFAECLRDGLLGIAGVCRAEANPRTGGMLLEYDRERLPLSLLKDALPLLTRAGDLENVPTAERASALRGILAALSEKLGA